MQLFCILAVVGVMWFSPNTHAMVVSKQVGLMTTMLEDHRGMRVGRREASSPNGTPKGMMPVSVGGVVPLCTPQCWGCCICMHSSPSLCLVLRACAVARPHTCTIQASLFSPLFSLQSCHHHPSSPVPRSLTGIPRRQYTTSSALYRV